MDLRLVILIFLVGSVSGFDLSFLIQNAAVTWIAYYGYTYWTTPERLSFREAVATRVSQLANDLPAAHLYEFCDRHRALQRTELHYMSFFDYLGMTEHADATTPPESVIVNHIERRKNMLLRSDVRLEVCLVEIKREMEETYRFFRFGPDYTENQVALLEPMNVSPCAPGKVSIAVKLYMDLNYMLSALTSPGGWDRYREVVEVFRPRHEAVLELLTALEQLKKHAFEPMIGKSATKSLQERAGDARTRFFEVQAATDQVLGPICNTTLKDGRP